MKKILSKMVPIMNLVLKNCFGATMSNGIILLRIFMAKHVTQNMIFQKLIHHEATRYHRYFQS